jgi:putative thioredoxin
MSAVFDVTSETFSEQVLEASHQRLVVVDFWAPWCAPCRMLGPLLERVVAACEGRAVLAKVNVDENQAVAKTYRVMSIPAVIAFEKGAAVAQFVGAQPEGEVRRWVESLLPSAADELATQAAALAEKGDAAAAEAMYQEALAANPGHVEAIVALAGTALGRGEMAEAGELVRRLGRPVPKEAEAVEARLWLTANVGEGRAIARPCDTVEGDLAARIGLACRLALRDEHEKALELLLATLTLNPKTAGGPVKEAMLRVFALLGPDHPMTRDYRRRLTSALYV